MAGAADGFQIGHLIAQDSIDLFNTGYSVYQDQRNYEYSKDVFDYNKALQQEIFNREDTAYERKRRDLERAGLNPNLAAGGSGSAAGAVVGNSNQAGDHPINKADLLRNYGAFLDAQKAAQEVKQSEYMTEALKNKNDSEQNNRENNQALEGIQRLFDSGADPSGYMIFNYVDNKGRPQTRLYSKQKLGSLLQEGLTSYGWTFDRESRNGIDSYGNPFSCLDLDKSKYWKSLENGWQIDLNDLSQSNLDTSMLSTEEEFQTSDKWFDYILKGLNLVFGSGGMAGAYNGARRNNARGRRSWR